MVGDLRGQTLQLIGTDGCPGLQRALDPVYPYAARQRCWAHKLRNVADRLPRKIQADCLRQASRIDQAETRREAVRQFREWSTRWRLTAPGAVSYLEQDLDVLLSF